MNINQQRLARELARLRAELADAEIAAPDLRWRIERLTRSLAHLREGHGERRNTASARLASRRQRPHGAMG